MLAASWAGSLPTWLILVGGLFVAWRVSRGGGGAAVTELSKANEVLTKRVHELGAEVRDLRVENEHLKSRTDFAQALAPILDGVIRETGSAQERQAAIIETLAQHELRAEERFRRTTDVLSLIADRLGTEADRPERRSSDRRAG